MTELVSFAGRRTSRPDNGRTKADRLTYRIRSRELYLLSFERPEMQVAISEYRATWARANNLASFPLFCEWLDVRR